MRPPLRWRSASRPSGTRQRCRRPSARALARLMFLRAVWLSGDSRITRLPGEMTRAELTLVDDSPARRGHSLGNSRFAMRSTARASVDGRRCRLLEGHEMSHRTRREPNRATQPKGIDPTTGKRHPPVESPVSKRSTSTGFGRGRKPATEKREVLSIHPLNAVVSADHQKRERPAHWAGRSEPSLQPRRGVWPSPQRSGGHSVSTRVLIC